MELSKQLAEGCREGRWEKSVYESKGEARRVGGPKIMECIGMRFTWEMISLFLRLNTTTAWSSKHL